MSHSHQQIGVENPAVIYTANLYKSDECTSITANRAMRPSSSQPNFYKLDIDQKRKRMIKLMAYVFWKLSEEVE